MDSEQRQAAWLQADDGLFQSVQETKAILFDAIQGLDDSGAMCASMQLKIETSRKELQVCCCSVMHTEQVLMDFNLIIEELIQKIATLHLQISQTRLFIARETVAHHDRIAMGLTKDELVQINELNAFIPASLDVYDKQTIIYL